MSSNVSILTYHNIDVAPSGSGQPWLYVRPEVFERQMWTLHRLGLRGVSMSEALRSMQSGRTRGYVVITFDDGYLDNFTNAAPVLRQYGFGATCYVVSGHVGGANDWDSDALHARKPLMGATDLSAWIEVGLEIGSHSISHPRLDRLNAEQALLEIDASRKQLRSLTGCTIDHFCYPYGRLTPDTVAVVRKAGYASAVSTVPGRAGFQENLFALPRIAIRGDEVAFEFFLKTVLPGGWYVSHSVRRGLRRLHSVLNPHPTTPGPSTP